MLRHFGVSALGTCLRKYTIHHPIKVILHNSCPQRMWVGAGLITGILHFIWKKENQQYGIVTEVEPANRLLCFDLFMQPLAKFSRSINHCIRFMVTSLWLPCPCSDKDINFVIQLVRELEVSNSPASLEQQNTKSHPGTNYEATPKSKIKEFYPMTFFSSS